MLIADDYFIIVGSYPFIETSYLKYENSKGVGPNIFDIPFNELNAEHLYNNIMKNSCWMDTIKIKCGFSSIIGEKN